MKCVKCFKPAKFKCINSRTPYCSYACIGGSTKRGREERQPSCMDGTEPFTFENYEDIPIEDLIVVNNKCYHFASLFNWVVNLDKTKDPLTGINFYSSEDEHLALVNRLNHEAKDKFPLKITYKESIILTTKLLSVPKLFSVLLPDASTPFEIMMQLAKNDYIMVFPGKKLDFEIFIENETKQLFDIKDIEDTLVIKSEPFTLDDINLKIQRLQKIVIFFNQKEWPTGDLEEILINVGLDRFKMKWIEKAGNEKVQELDNLMESLRVSATYKSKYRAWNFAYKKLSSLRDNSTATDESFFLYGSYSYGMNDVPRLTDDNPKIYFEWSSDPSALEINNIDVNGERFYSPDSFKRLLKRLSLTLNYPLKLIFDDKEFIINQNYNSKSNTIIFETTLENIRQIIFVIFCALTKEHAGKIDGKIFTRDIDSF
jgi:hypothetical protein